MSANTNSGAKEPGRPFSGGRGFILFIILLGAAGYFTYRTLWNPPLSAAAAVKAVLVCSETNKSFEYTMKEGEDFPVMSPYSNKKTGYQAEQCFWTKDGKRKSTPTYVILNSRLGRPGDTLCPDCGRLVVGHNPLPPDNVPLANGNAPGKGK